MTADTAPSASIGTKKGTEHLTFKRPDLVDQCNRILAKRYPEALAHDPR